MEWSVIAISEIFQLSIPVDAVPYALRYSFNTLCVLSIPPKVWWWCGVLKLCWVFVSLQSSRTISLRYSVPQSVKIDFGVPEIKINSSKIAFAIVFASLLATGIATNYFVKSQISVIAYSFLQNDFWKGPIVSISTTSNGFWGVGVIFIGSRVATLGLFNMHFSHLLT